MSTATPSTGQQAGLINGINVDALRQAVRDITADPSKGKTSWRVVTHWKGGTRSDSDVDGYQIGGQKSGRGFQIQIDEPEELLGTNQFANPQQYLLAAMNACLMATYVGAASQMGVRLTNLEIETEGDIDLRGFLGIDSTVPAGYDELRYTVRVSGDGTPRQFEKMHEAVQATSPNYYNLARAIPLRGSLVVE